MGINCWPAFASKLNARVPLSNNFALLVVPVTVCHPVATAARNYHRRQQPAQHLPFWPRRALHLAETVRDWVVSKVKYQIAARPLWAGRRAIGCRPTIHVKA